MPPLNDEAAMAAAGEAAMGRALGQAAMQNRTMTVVASLGINSGLKRLRPLPRLAPLLRPLLCWGYGPLYTLQPASLPYLPAAPPPPQMQRLSTKLKR